MSKISLLSVLTLPDKKNWKLRTLQENLNDCYNQKLYTDVEIRIQDRTFKAHKNILSFYSPLFQKAFYGTKNPSSSCTVNDITAEGFTILLRFLYCSQIPDKADANDLVEACFAAQILEMVGIREKLVNYILCKSKPGTSGKPSIGEAKFWSLLMKSRSLKLRELEEMLLNFAENHFTSILCNEDFSKADSETIKLVLNKKPDCVPERYILERIAYWKDSNSNFELLNEQVQELLSCVNFANLSPKEFYTVVSEHDSLISGKDSLDILMHLVDPEVCSIPKWYDCNYYYNPGVSLKQAPSVNLKDWSKTDKFKSLEDLQLINNLSLPAGRGKRNVAFRSQEDLRTIPWAESLQTWNGKKSNRRAKSSHGKTLRESFSQMLKEGLFTDVILIAKDETKIPAHRLVLALGSEFFASILYGTVPSKTIRFEERPEEVKTMLKYFYGSGEKISCKTLPSALDSVLRKTDMALKYRCYPLLQAYNLAFLQVTLDPCTCWKLLDQADKLMYCKVNNMLLMKYVMTATRNLFDHESFHKATKNALVKVLKSDYLNMEECDLLENVTRWLKMNAVDFPTDQSRKELLMHIRFEALNTEQFFEYVKKHDGFLPKDDLFAIFTFLFRQSGENRLPEWCYSGPLRSIFYDAVAHIGTYIPIPWKAICDKASDKIACSYTVAISNKILESEVQFLEVSLKFKTKHESCKKCNCNISVMPDNGSKVLTFNDLNLVPGQRFLLPVFFSLNSQTPKITFSIHVLIGHAHKFYPINMQMMRFDSVVFEALTANNCISDAIVDDLTCKKVRIPRHLLLNNRDRVITTEKMFHKDC